MKRRDQRLVYLQHRLASGEHHERRRAAIAAPRVAAGAGKRTGIGELAATIAIGANKIGVAEIADGASAVGLAAGPQVAAGETAEHGGPPRLGAFALQRVEDFLDRIHRLETGPSCAPRQVLFVIASSLSSPGLTGRSSNHHPQCIRHVVGYWTAFAGMTSFEPCVLLA